ncbi:GDSL-type esterase/lipase family protein, partial [Corynebacterium bovis]
MKHRRTTRWTSIADALTAGRRTVVTSVAAALTVGAATVAAVTGVTPAAQADDHGGIVMLGDSYFANTTLPQVVGALTGLGEQGCVKGEYRPATEVARITGAPVQDFSCNGTRLYGEGNVIDAHIDEAVRAGALNPGTAFVPVMIGANDGLASNGAIDPGAAAQGFDRVAQRVRAAAPNARLLFVSYPSITNDRGNTCPLRLNGLPPTELPVGSIGATENLLWGARPRRGGPERCGVPRPAGPDPRARHVSAGGSGVGRGGRRHPDPAVQPHGAPVGGRGAQRRGADRRALLTRPG